MSAQPPAVERICLTNPFAWPQVRRGTETLVRSLARWLHASGADVEIVAGGPARAKYDLDGVPVVLVKARRATRVHRDLDAETTFVPAMARHLRRTQPSVVHSFLYSDATAARLARRPYVVSYGGIALPSSFAGHPIKRRLFRFASEGARAVLCPSQSAAQHLLDSYGYRARVIPNGIDASQFGGDAPRQPGLVLCTATPNDDRKRVSVLVDAMVIANRRHPGAIELLLAGDASAERRESLAARVPDDQRSRLRFAGEVDDEELRRLYATAMVTCLPSLNEAFGMVVIESLAAGTPVVGAAHGALPELIDHEVGALFAPDDSEACADALLSVLERAGDPAMTARCQAEARCYDWSVVGPQLQRVYEEVAR